MAPTLHAHRAAGKSTPTSDKAHVASAGRVEEHGAADSADFAARPAVGQANKAFATLRAHLALHGFALHIVSDGATGTAYMVQRWCMSRSLQDLNAVAAFARQIGARP